MNIDENYKMPLIGDYAPAFHGVSTNGDIDFPSDYYGRWVVFFSHPGDFTPVCTTEFMTFASMVNDFRMLNTELLGLSVDGIYSHIAWLRKIKELSWKNLKHVEVTFPLIADVSMEIAKKYGMIQPGSSNTQTVRAVFIIDPEGIIRAILYYPPTTGRNMDEIMRIIIALQKSDQDNVATPANWMPYDDVILPAPRTLWDANYRVNNPRDMTYCLDWFLCFQQNYYQENMNYLPEVLPYPSIIDEQRRY